MTPSFFGYGSLVNLATHDYPNPRKATLEGWQRVWRHAKTRDVAFLSVRKAPGSIHGLMCDVPQGDWTALNAREHAYQRCDISAQLGGDTSIYVADPAKTASPCTSHPILLSYLDVVVQGYFDQFGETGVSGFFESTDGWGPIKDDRHDPIYPRHQTLTKAERSLVDFHLAQIQRRI